MSTREKLPKGWARTKIAKTVLPRETCNPHKERSGNIFYVDIEALDNARQVIISPKTIPASEAPSRARMLIHKGDILFSLVRPYLKNIAVVPDELDNQLASTAYCVLRPTGSINSKFLFYQLCQDSFINSVPTYGNSPPSARDDEFLNMEIVTAPMEDQLRVVARIEELLSDLDAGVAALKRAQANLKRYRAAVLKAAVEGKLTEQWRKDNPPREIAAQLLDRILAERRRKWEAAQLAKYAAAGKTPPKDWKSKYKAPMPPDTSILPPLPEGWVWATLEQIAAPELNSITDGPFGSNLKSEHYTESGPRVIRLQNIGDGIFVDEEAHISESHFQRLQKHCVFADDLVIAALGENPPRSCLIPRSLGPAIVKADCIRFKLHRDINGKYINAALNSDPVRHRSKSIVHGVGRPRLNLGEVKSVIIPLSPVGEQESIIQEVDQRLSAIDRLEIYARTGLQRALRLRQSILQKNFIGPNIQ